MGRGKVTHTHTPETLQGPNCVGVLVTGAPEGFTERDLLKMQDVKLNAVQQAPGAACSALAAACNHPTGNPRLAQHPGFGTVNARGCAAVLFRINLSESITPMMQHLSSPLQPCRLVCARVGRERGFTCGCTMPLLLSWLSVREQLEGDGVHLSLVWRLTFPMLLRLSPQTGPDSASLALPGRWPPHGELAHR